MKTPSPTALSTRPAAGGGSGFIVLGRSASLSSQIVADVREALFAKRLKPGDFLGTEKDLAGRHGVSRSATRCAPSRRSASSRSAWARAAAPGWRAAIRGCSPRRSPCSSI
jgi:hypothetical protein